MTRASLAAVILLPLIATLCALIMGWVSSLPAEPLAENLRGDLAYFKQERPRVFNGRKIDAGTECMGISFGLPPRFGADAKGKQPDETAITPIVTEGAFHYGVRVPAIHNCSALSAYLSSPDGDGREQIYDQYARYWHGYAAISRPLLQVLPYRELKMLVSNAVILLTLFFAYSVYQAFGLRMVAAIFLPFLFINYAGYITLWTKAVTWIVAFAAATYICRTYPSRSAPPYIAFFLFGCATAFFDWLTAPLLILMLPMLVYVLHQLQARILVNWQLQIARAMALGGFWLFGYVGLWALKILLAYFVIGPEVLQSTMEIIGFRFGGAHEGVHHYLGAATWENLEVLKIFGGLLFLITFILVPALKGSIRRRLIANIRYAPVLGLIALSPFVWYEVVSNHSQLHGIFTHILLVIYMIPVSIAIWGIDLRQLAKRSSV